MNWQGWTLYTVIATAVAFAGIVSIEIAIQRGALSPDDIDRALLYTFAGFLGLTWPAAVFIVPAVLVLWLLSGTAQKIAVAIAVRLPERDKR